MCILHLTDYRCVPNTRLGITEKVKADELKEYLEVKVCLKSTMWKKTLYLFIYSVSSFPDNVAKCLVNVFCLRKGGPQK